MFFCLLTRKPIFFYFVLKSFLESTRSTRPSKNDFKDLITPKCKLREVQRREHIYPGWILVWDSDSYSEFWVAVAVDVI